MSIGNLQTEADLERFIERAVQKPGVLPPERANGYSEDVGDGVATSIVVTHNLGTRDVLIEVYRNSAPYETIAPTAAQRTNETQATVVFGVAPTTDQYRVVIRKV